MIHRNMTDADRKRVLAIVEEWLAHPLVEVWEHSEEPENADMILDGESRDMAVTISIPIPEAVSVGFAAWGPR